MNGIKKVRPCIKKISFPLKGKMKLHLKDGRDILVPVKYFDKIRKLTKEQRSKWYVDVCDDIFHIEQVLGTENDYRYRFKKKSAYQF